MDRPLLAHGCGLAKGVRKGTPDLESDLRSNRLKAPGKLTLSVWSSLPAQNGFGTFMGLPPDAVITSLRNGGGKIVVDSVLEEDGDNPQFSLNEALTTWLVVSMAETLGVSLSGLAKGAGSLGEKSVQATGEAATGAVRQLFKGKHWEQRQR